MQSSMEYIRNRLSAAFGNTSKITSRWSHIELGAANYGKDPHADRTHDNKNINQEKQLKLLFTTVDDLIKNNGPKGTFYINDLKLVDVNYAIKLLKQYIKKYHPNCSIKVEPLVGDFFKIDLPKVDSIHLKNPEYWFFNSLDQNENTNRLQYFADQSKTGLTLATYFKRPFLNRLEKLGVGYKVLNDDFGTYHHSDGSVVTRYGNIVEFHVKSKNTLEVEEESEYFTKYTPAQDPENERKISNMYFDIFGSKVNELSIFSDDFIDPNFVSDVIKNEQTRHIAGK